MKYDINDLYLAKCRFCIMDIMNAYYEDGKIIEPRPDYIDYYTILYLKKNENRFINVFNKKLQYEFIDNVSNPEEYYLKQLIIETQNLSNFIDQDEYKRFSTKECFIIEHTIIKTKRLNGNYGYKKR